MRRTSRGLSSGCPWRGSRWASPSSCRASRSPTSAWARSSSSRSSRSGRDPGRRCRPGLPGSRPSAPGPCSAAPGSWRAASPDSRSWSSRSPPRSSCSIPWPPCCWPWWLAASPRSGCSASFSGASRWPPPWRWPSTRPWWPTFPTRGSWRAGRPSPATRPITMSAAGSATAARAACVRTSSCGPSAWPASPPGSACSLPSPWATCCWAGAGRGAGRGRWPS